MPHRLRALLAIINLAVEEAEQQTARQRKRVEQLRDMRLSAEEEEKTLLTIELLASAMREQQLVMERLMSGVTQH